MTSLKSPFLQELSERGFLHQCTHLEELDQKAAKESLTLYGGFDATASSLHVGNLMLVMMFRIAERHGHKPIVLMGGATTKIGDPSGKDKTRPVITDEQIERNIGSIQQCFSRYVTFGDDSANAILVNNNDWLAPVKYLDFLSTYGRHFSINRMLAFDSVKLRLEREQPLTFLEFNYMILQAYDFLELYRRHKCVLQLGGSDQWGNIVNGVELIRRIHNGESFGLTAPLITTASGKKMGKSEQGAIWLNKDALSPFHYWQYWRNTEDADVIRFLKFYTDLSVKEIEQLAKDEDINALKIRLADEATALAHGASVLPEIHQSIAQVFGGDNFHVDITGQDDKGNPILKSALPIIQVPMSKLEAGIPAFVLLSESGLASSNGEARRLVRGKGCKVNDTVIEDENDLLSRKDLQESNVLKLSVGKKRHILIQGVF